MKRWPVFTISILLVVGTASWLRKLRRLTDRSFRKIWITSHPARRYILLPWMAQQVRIKSKHDEIHSVLLVNLLKLHLRINTPIILDYPLPMVERLTVFTSRALPTIVTCIVNYAIMNCNYKYLFCFCRGFCSVKAFLNLLICLTYLCIPGPKKT